MEYVYVKGGSRREQSQMMPVVLYFSSATHIQGGAVQCMFRIARWLKREGGTPIVVLPREGDIIDWYTREGIEVQVIPFVEMHRRWSPLYLIRYALSTIGIVIKLARLVRQCCVDLVHVNEPIYWPGLIAGKIAGAKTVCHVRMILDNSVGARYVLTEITQRFSDHIICASRAVRDKMFPSRENNVRVAYDPPDLNRFDPQLVEDRASIRQELGIAQETYVVGLVSKFIANKGHISLIQAADLIKTRNPNLDVNYLIVGGKVAGHKAYYAEVVDRINQYDLEESFLLTGAREDVPRLMKACDVMVHLPRHEDPFPGVVVEAMAMEKPFVGFASGGIPEQFEHRKSGILLQKGDIEALAETLLELSESKDLREEMGKQARHFVRSHFSSERFFSELRPVYVGPEAGRTSAQVETEGHQE